MPFHSIMCPLALAAACIAATPALAADGNIRAVIGDLRLYHDPAEWRIEGEAGTWEVHCRGAECDDPLMTIVAMPAELTACSPGAVIDRSSIDFPDAWTREATYAGAVGLKVHVATLDQGCRNMAGSPVYACTVHNGTAYWFVAPGDLCHTDMRESTALQALLNGLSTAAAAGE